MMQAPILNAEEEQNRQAVRARLLWTCRQGIRLATQGHLPDRVVIVRVENMEGPHSAVAAEVCAAVKSEFAGSKLLVMPMYDPVGKEIRISVVVLFENFVWNEGGM